jgi:hypothetical protein
VTGCPLPAGQVRRGDGLAPGELPATAGYNVEVFKGERLLAAIVLYGQGSVLRFRQAVQLAVADWRDLLVAAELADEDWPERLDAALGS